LGRESGVDWAFFASSSPFTPAMSRVLVKEGNSSRGQKLAFTEDDRKKERKNLQKYGKKH